MLYFGTTGGKLWTLNLGPIVETMEPMNALVSTRTTMHYRVRFSEDVTPADPSALEVVMGGSLTGAAILDVTAESPSAWIVTLDTGAGEGTLGLRLVDDDSITDLDPVPLPLEGLATYVGDYTAAEVYTLTEPRIAEGEGEGEGQLDPRHTADQNGDGQISLSELLRVIQLYNAQTFFHCDASTEDGYALGAGDDTCTPHASDYNEQNWRINLSEILRTIQFYNAGAYHPCEQGEDGYCTQ